MANQPITATAAYTMTRAANANNVLIMNSATGFTVTLPAALGYNDTYTIFVQTTVSSGNHVVQVANATDVMNGGISLSTDVAGVTLLFAATDDTITMNGSTQGGVQGSWLTFTDVKAGFWKVGGFLCTTGAEADGLSAAVS